MSDPETIGQRLCAAREARELTLEEAERATRIRLKFLDALERGDYSGMTAVQVQGFMRNYTRFLGLDYDLLLTEFDSTNKSRGRRRAKESPIPQAAPPQKSSARRPSVGRFFNRLIALVLAAAVIGVLAIAAVMIIRQLTDSAAEKDGGTEPITQTLQQTPAETPLDQASAPQPSETLDPSQTQGSQPTLDSGVGQTAFTPPTLTGEGIVLEVQVVHRVWLRVTADDTVQYEGVAEEGSVLHYTATNTMGLRTTDASALMIIINNQALGTLGGRGELFDQTFSLDTGLWVPNEGSAAMAVTLTETPTLTLTSTTSPEPATLTYTPTVLPTSTFTPGPTATQGPTATLSDGISSADLGGSASTSTRAPSVPGPTATRVVPSETPRPFQPTVTETPMPAPTSTLTPSPTNPPPPIPTRTVTPSLTPSLTITPSPTVSRTPTMTPTITPFLPPRMTRTPSPAPK